MPIAADYSTTKPVRAEDLQEIIDLLNADWAAYGTDAANLTATSVNPTKGSSTYLFESCQMNSSLIAVRFAITINTGGGFAAGTGAWRFAVPSAASANAQSATVGSVWVNDSGTALRVGALVFADSTHVEATIYNITGNALGAAGPGTAWATGDAVRGSITYEPA